MSLTKTLSKLFFAIVALAAGMNAGATTIIGTFNDASYQTYSLNLATASMIDIRYTDGYYDSTLSLFNGANLHLITNDDFNGTYASRITTNLAAGHYTLLVSYCCTARDFITQTSTVAATDGFNQGYYYYGGSATLDGVEAVLASADTAGVLSGADFTLQLTGAEISVDTPVDPASPVPEPQSLALFGMAMAALAMARRRQVR